MRSPWHTQRFLPVLGMALAWMACSCAPQTSGSEHRADAGPSETPNAPEGPSSTEDGDAGDTPSGDTGSGDSGSGEGDGHGGSGDSQTGEPHTDGGVAPPSGQDAGGPGMWTDQWVSHYMETCDPGRFAGFTIFIGKTRTTCDEFWFAADEKMMFVVGDGDLLPPASGRTYDVVPEPTAPGGIYPSDGDTTLQYEDEHGDFWDGESGTLTVMSSGPEELTGSYEVTLENGGQISGHFTSEKCVPICE